VTESSSPGCRPVLLWLAAAGAAGLAAELTMTRHWHGLQLVAWVVLAGIVAAILLGTRRLSPRVATTIRWIAVICVVASLYGIWAHVQANLDAAPLDRIFGDRWEAMSGWARLWAAGTAQVGPAPTLVPAAMGYVAAMVWLAARPRAG